MNVPHKGLEACSQCREIAGKIMTSNEFYGIIIPGQALNLRVNNRLSQTSKANTGSGKTLAFVLPMLHKLYVKYKPKNAHEVHAMIIVPTRELALQIFRVVKELLVGNLLYLTVV